VRVTQPVQGWLWRLVLLLLWRPSGWVHLPLSGLLALLTRKRSAMWPYPLVAWLTGERGGAGRAAACASPCRLPGPCLAASCSQGLRPLLHPPVAQCCQRLRQGCKPPHTPGHAPAATGGGFWNLGAVALVHGARLLLPWLPHIEALLGGAALAFMTRSYAAGGSSGAPADIQPGWLSQGVVVLAALLLALMVVDGGGGGRGSGGGGSRSSGRRSWRSQSGGGAGGGDKSPYLEPDKVAGAEGAWAQQGCSRAGAAPLGCCTSLACPGQALTSGPCP
jgi:hypothetical protein